MKHIHKKGEWELYHTWMVLILLFALIGVFFLYDFAVTQTQRTSYCESINMEYSPNEVSPWKTCSFLTDDGELRYKKIPEYIR
jgi:hypothetical protein